VHRRDDVDPGPRVQIAVLQVVRAVEDDDRGAGERLGAEAGREPASREVGAAHRPVAHPAQQGGGAAGDRVGVRGHRRHDRAGAQQGAGVRLVLAVQVDADVAGQRRQRGQHPGGHRVGVDRDRQRGHPLGREVAAELTGDVSGQEIDLPGEAQHGLTGLGDLHRLGPHQQDPAGRDLQRAQPLADRRRGDVQRAGGGLQGAPANGGVERPQLGQIQVHEQQG
jgi:hypothetical protein